MSEFSRSCRPMLLILGLPPRSEGRLAVAVASRNEWLRNGRLWRKAVIRENTEVS
jgi:hypothetical protein